MGRYTVELIQAEFLIARFLFMRQGFCESCTSD